MGETYTRDQGTVAVVYDSIVHTTSAAVLIRLDSETYWIPLSQIINWDRDKNYLEIPEWLAIEKGLE